MKKKLSWPRRLVHIALAAAMTMTGFLVLSSPASAGVYGTYALYSQGKCLDAGGSSAQMYFVDAFCDFNNPNHKWYFDGEFGGNGNYGGKFLIRSQATGLCIDGGGSQFARSYQTTCDRNNPNHLWAEERAPEEMAPGGSKAVVLYRNLATGLYLDGGGDYLYLRDRNNPPNNRALVWFRPGI